MVAAVCGGGGGLVIKVLGLRMVMFGWLLDYPSRKLHTSGSGGSGESVWRGFERTDKEKL